MNLLIQIRGSETDKEIKEFTVEQGNWVCISHSTEESITQLSQNNIDKAVISLNSLRDAAILKYLNDYFPGISVVVIANKEFDDIISIFKKGNYKVIHEPLKLSELKGKLKDKIIQTK